ncbi:hypothetical protein [Enterococcus thailandicus]
MKKFRVVLESKDVYEVVAETREDAINALVYPIHDPNITITNIDVDSSNFIEADEVVEG